MTGSKWTLPFVLSLLCYQSFEIDEHCSPCVEDKAPICTGFEIFDQHCSCDKHLVYITVPLLSDLCSPSHLDIWKQMQTAFVNESNVEVMLRSCVDVCDFSVTHYEPVSIDRVCLMKPPYSPSRGKHILQGDATNVSSVLAFINTHTTSNRQLNGTKTKYGNFLNDITNNQYKVPSSPEAVLLKCDRISFQSLQLDPQEFILKYWIRQQPVIIENFPSIHDNDGTGSRERNSDVKIFESLTSTTSSMLDVSQLIG